MRTRIGIVAVAALLVLATPLPVLASQTDWVGGDLGAELTFDLDCGSESVMTGITVNHSSRAIGKVRAICQRISSEGKWSGSPTYTNWSPTNAGSYASHATAKCATDMVVAGLRGRTTSYSTAEQLNGIQLYCRGIDGNGYLQGSSVALDWLGAPGVQSTYKACPSNEPARAILGRSKTYVHKIGFDCGRLQLLQVSVPAPYASLCTQSCGNNAGCLNQCKLDYNAYVAWIGQMSSGVPMYALPPAYAEALKNEFPGIDPSSWRYGYSPRQPAKNATTDCDKTYFNDQSYVGKLRNTGVVGEELLEWMFHELEHYSQCVTWGGRYNYIHRWWNEQRAASGGTIDIWEIHDNMPMENLARGAEGRVWVNMLQCCIGGPKGAETLNRPLVLSGISGPREHTLPRSGALSFELQAQISGGPAKYYVEWTLDGDAAGSLSWAKTVDNGRRLQISNPPAGTYTVRASARYVGRPHAQSTASATVRIRD